MNIQPDGQLSLVSKTKHPLEMPTSLPIWEAVSQARGDYPCTFPMAETKGDVPQPPSMNMKMDWARDIGQGPQPSEMLPTGITAGVAVTSCKVWRHPREAEVMLFGTRCSQHLHLSAVGDPSLPSHLCCGFSAAQKTGEHCLCPLCFMSTLPQG